VSAASGPLQRLGGRALLPVAPAAIEAELGRLWRQASEDGGSAVRIRVLNLIAVAFDDRSAEDVGIAVEEVAGCHPNRSVVVHISPDAERDSLRAAIAASFRTEASSRQLYGEEIVLEGHADDTQLLVSSVASLLVPDLPTALWWPPGLPSGHLYNDLSELADWLIIDTAGAPPASTTFDAMRATEHAELTLADLSWARLFPWRDLTAHFFDHPTFREYLEAISYVEVEAAGNTSTPSLLLLAWLASRLNWSPVDARRGSGGAQVVFASGIQPIEASLRATGDDGSDLVRLRLASDRPARAVFEVTCDKPGQATARSEVDGAETEHRSAALAPVSAGALLCRQLDEAGHDRVFEQSLAIARDIAHLIEGE
jgi:glucose-6-phosphate dehydrogenase assembly protein OpcA